MRFTLDLLADIDYGASIVVNWVLNYFLKNHGLTPFYYRRK